MNLKYLEMFLLFLTEALIFCGQIGDNIEYAGLYIGVTKRRKSKVGLEKVRWVTSLAFHEVTR